MKYSITVDQDVGELLQQICVASGNPSPEKLANAILRQKLDSLAQKVAQSQPQSQPSATPQSQPSATQSLALSMSKAAGVQGNFNTFTNLGPLESDIPTREVAPRSGAVRGDNPDPFEEGATASSLVQEAFQETAVSQDRPQPLLPQMTPGSERNGSEPTGTLLDFIPNVQMKL